MSFSALRRILGALALCSFLGASCARSSSPDAVPADDAGDDASSDTDVGADGGTFHAEAARPAMELSAAAYFAATFGVGLDDVRFGELHVHTSYSLDSAGCTFLGGDPLDPSGAYAWAREEEALDFVALSDHAEQPNALARPPAHKLLGLSVWESEVALSEEANEEAPATGKPFVVFPAFEYTNTHGLKPSCAATEAGVMGSETGYGHKVVLFRDLAWEGLPPARIGASPQVEQSVYAETAQDLWEALAPWAPSDEDDPLSEGAALTIVHTPAAIADGGECGGATDHRTDWGAMHAAFVRHVEIASKWGVWEGPGPDLPGCDSGEILEYEPSPEADPLAVRRALYEHWVVEGDPRFVLGFVGGTDGHAGRPSQEDAPLCGMDHRGSVTGIVAAAPTRAALWTGLWRRRTLATAAGARTAVLLAAESGGAHAFMGERLPHDGSARFRAIAGPAIRSLELIVDGCVALEIPNSSALDVVLPLPPGRHYAYVRAFSEVAPLDLRPAWSSPVYLE